MAESIFDNDDIKPKAVPVDPPNVKGDDAPKRRGRPPGSISQKTVDKIEESINEFLAMPAMAFAMVGDNYCAWVLTGFYDDEAHTPGPGRAWAHSWAQLAKQSPQVRKVLMKMIEGGAWGGVIASTMGVALPIALHHGALPERFNGVAQMMGVPMPEEGHES